MTYVGLVKYIHTYLPTYLPSYLATYLHTKPVPSRGLKLL